MSDWDPAQYLKFSAERTQACRDLAARVAALIPPNLVRQVVDLGCGPGNSTDVLSHLWPDATITGLDNSANMIAAARARYPESDFSQTEIRHWAENTTGRFDIVFSNAALQWVPDHASLLPLLLRRVAPGGLLAFQVPANWNAAACLLPRTFMTMPQWTAYFPADRRIGWQSHGLDFYYDLLALQAGAMEMWETDYFQVLDRADQIVDWYQGTGLRPYLDALPDDAARARFIEEYREGVHAAYTPRADGKVLFTFRRRFLIAEARERS